METSWLTTESNQRDAERLEPTANGVHDNGTTGYVGAPVFSASTLELAQISNQTSTSSAPGIDPATATRFSFPPPPL